MNCYQSYVILRRKSRKRTPILSLFLINVENGTFIPFSGERLIFRKEKDILIHHNKKIPLFIPVDKCSILQRTILCSLARDLEAQELTPLPLRCCKKLFHSQYFWQLAFCLFCVSTFFVKTFMQY